MRRLQLAIFDFDGTLADSFPFFLSVFNQLAVQHRFSTIDVHKACALRGYSVTQMMRHVGMPSWKLPLVARSFMALMKENSHAVSVFDGVTEMLRHLDANGIMLAIVTSNSHANVAAVLGTDNMARIRHIETGASIFGKASRIARVLGKSGLSCEQAIYIGDQATDREAARKAKVAFGAVAWGYASIESLAQHRPDYIFHSVSDIHRLATASHQA
jgi:phosphoglycolate phosphatase